MGNLRFLLGLAGALAVASFGAVNMEVVTIDYYWGTLSLRLFYLLLAVFTAGFLIAWLGGLFDRMRYRRAQRALRRQVREVEREMERVREQSGRLLAASNEHPGDQKPQETYPALPPPAGAAARPDREEGKDGPNA
ncbi:MAG: DUF1049 domain-containing protein [Candidatus Tectomicrobia bacterium]|uniref:DUF1049 domain-containing protein n=1 Tax=Tectimicrobiota bacterium TaxID=2528274 RepID=A0A932I0G3_UNCTE|nr:DUF1049 domain-containing protein [Candidatus Tectomicrobia bacterium]